MAYVASNGQDPNQQNGQPNQGGSGTIMSGGMPAGGGGASSVYQGSTASRGNPSGTPNIQDYLNANQGAGQRLSGAISGNVQNQANQVNQNVSQAQTNLNNQYNPLNTQLQGGQSAANTSFQDPQALLAAYQASQAGTTDVNATGTNGSQYSYNPNTQGWTDNSGNATTFNNAFGMNQNQALTDYNALQGNVSGTAANNALQQQIQNYNQAGQQANQQLTTQLQNLYGTTGSAANQMGQQALLSQTVGTPNYTSGQQALDALFLQGQGNQLQQNLNNIYNTTSNTAINANQDYQNKLAALNQLAGSNNAYTQNLFLNGNASQNGQGLNQIAGDVQNQYNALAGPNGTAAQAQTALQNAVASNNFTPAQLQQLGLTNGQQTWGLTGQQLMNAGGLQNNAVLGYSNGGAAQAATAQQMARYNALNQLAGGPNATAQSSIFGGSTTAGYNPYQVNNPTGLTNAINTQQQAVTGADFQNALTSTEQALKNLSGGGYTDTYANNFANTLGQATNSNQAEQDIQNYINGMKQMGWNNNTGDYNAVNPFQNYYSGTYVPDITSSINGMAEPATAGYNGWASAGPANTGPMMGPGPMISPNQESIWNSMINGTYTPPASGS